MAVKLSSKLKNMNWHSGILFAIIVLAGISLYLHIPLKVDVLRDRGMPKVTETGAIENVYRLQVMNTKEQKQHYAVRVVGVAGAELLMNSEIEVNAATTKAFPVRVRIPAASVQVGSNRIRFEIQDTDEPAVKVTEKAVFIVPR